MRRKQVYIDEDLDEGLRRLADATGEPEAAHVRAAIRRYLAEVAEPREPYDAASDPLLAFIGVAGDDSGPDDAAEEHDHYLYGTPKRAARSSR